MIARAQHFKRKSPSLMEKKKKIIRAAHHCRRGNRNTKPLDDAHVIESRAESKNFVMGIEIC